MHNQKKKKKEEKERGRDGGREKKQIWRQNTLSKQAALSGVKNLKYILRLEKISWNQSEDNLEYSNTVSEKLVVYDTQNDT